jgi:BirA family biotin operon repressor/biotin-[acetyl-CoA-carboxylase] ligase
MGNSVVTLSQIDSTQTIAKAYANQNKPEGLVVIAETQTAGKGRMGRQWVSDQGGLWVSLILRPDIPPQKVPLIPLVVSVAIAKAIEKTCGLKCWLKWPNDVLMDPTVTMKIPPTATRSPLFSRRDFYYKSPLERGVPEGRGVCLLKKVCGILTEMSAESDRVNWVVLGFGINVNNDIPELLKEQACSLKEIKGKPVNGKELLQTVLHEIESVYFQFLKNGFAGLKTQYLKQCLFKKGTKVVIADSGQKKSGKFWGIGDDGSLILQTSPVEKEVFFAGQTTTLSHAQEPRLR